MLNVYPLYAISSWIFLKVDKILFPGYKKLPVQQPVFIVGSFRSGTTFLQRLMCMDRKHFSCAMSWELIFAPSVSQRKFFRGLFFVDGLLGKPLRKLWLWIEEKLLDEKSAHKMGMQQHEEDEAFFIHIYASAFLFFANPYESTKKYYWYDKSEIPRRKKIEMAFYKSCVKRHMYFHSESQFYLSKSPTFSSRLKSLVDTFPDAKIIYLARHPLDVLPSLFHWFTQVWNKLEKDNIRFPFRDFLIEFVRHWYVDALDTLKTLPADQVRVIKYDDLISDSYHVVEEIYDWLDIDMSPEMKELMIKEKVKAKNNWKSKVHNLGLDNLRPQVIREIFAPVFNRFGFSIKKYSNM